MKIEAGQSPSDIEYTAIRRAILERWRNHEFYQSAVVLGLDVGIEGIGVWLRKGPECLFRGTFIVPLPEAAPLKGRRLLRAGRHARASRRRRDRMLKEWAVRNGLLDSARADALWNHPRAFERAYEHRWRAISEDKALASPEALIVCIRHCVRHRGYDHHLLFRDENLTYPWGDELEIKAIREWGKRGVLPEEYGNELKLLIEESDELKNEKQSEALRILDEAMARYRTDPIRTMLEEHLRERQHVNRRTPARGHNFPRELVKTHLRQICERHRHFFPSDRFDTAMRALIGPLENGVEIYDPKAESIMDWHRRTPGEARRLWERHEGRCALAPYLIAAGLLPPGIYRRSPAGAESVRRWKLVQFLAERRVELATGERTQVTVELVRQALDVVSADCAALRERKPRPKAPGMIKAIEKALGKPAPKTQSRFNKDFFDQLDDLLKPQRSKLGAKAPLAEATAEALFRLATNNGTSFEPDAIRERLTDGGYYEWRQQSAAARALYHQVDYLLGDPRQYDPETGEPKDRRDDRPRFHGILPRLFAGQLRLDTGETVDLRDRLDSRAVPDYVIVESVRDMPRNADQRRDIQNEQKERREDRRKIAAKYGLDFDALTDQQIRRLFLFHEQSDRDGEAFCPYTGESLGRDPLAADLEIEHIYPQGRGGLSIMENFAVTRRATNAEKGNRTPVEWLGFEKAMSLSARMKWSERKKKLFLWREEGCPDWENLTRTAQLARELRRRVIEWLGIERRYAHVTDPTERAKAVAAETRRRVAAPSGALTAACRECWKDRLPAEYFKPIEIVGRTALVKNRGNLRHHLWDAGVLAQIPPGDGLNHVLYGGIFETTAAGGEPRPAPLPELAPNIAEIEKQDPLACRVFRLRPRHPRGSRTTQQPVSLPDAEGLSWQRVAIQKEINEKDGVVKTVKPEKLRDAVRRAGLGPERISDAEIERWQNDPRPIERHPLRLRDGTPVYSLRLPISQQKNEVGRHPHLTDAATAPSAPIYRSRDGRREHRLIGIKGVTDTYDRLEIWRGPELDRKGKPRLEADGRPKLKCFSVLIPSARNIAAYRRMWGKPPAIRRPEGVTELVGCIRKGDLLLVPFGPRKEGQFELVSEGAIPFAPLWMRAISIKESGEVTLQLAEHDNFATTALKFGVAADKTHWRPASAQTLARLLRETKAVRPRDSSSDSHQRKS